MRMSNITQLSAAQLTRAADLQTKIETLQAELTNVLGGTAPARATAGPPARGPGRPRRRRLSAAGRARIVAASRAYWAKVRTGRGGAAAAPKRKRKVTAAARARLSALAKARWAKAKAAGKSRL